MGKGVVQMRGWLLGCVHSSRTIAQKPHDNRSTVGSNKKIKFAQRLLLPLLRPTNATSRGGFLIDNLTSQLAPRSSLSCIVYVAISLSTEADFWETTQDGQRYEAGELLWCTSTTFTFGFA